MEKKKLLKIYDISPAVLSRRVLILEAHTLEDCYNLVYKPTQDLLSRLAKQRPKFLLFLAERPYYLKEGGTSAIIDIVSPENKIFYLGTARDSRQAKAIWKWWLDFCKGQPEKIKILQERGPMAILRDRIGCNIPVPCSYLTKMALNRAIKKYLKAFCPALLSVPIKWLPLYQQRILEDEIWDQARATAEEQSEEEKRRIRLEDSWQ